MKYFNTPERCLEWILEYVESQLVEELSSMNLPENKGKYNSLDRQNLAQRLTDIRDLKPAIKLVPLTWTVTLCQANGIGGHYTEVVSAVTLDGAMEAAMEAALMELDVDSADELHVLHVLQGRHAFQHYDDTIFGG